MSDSPLSLTTPPKRTAWQRWQRPLLVGGVLTVANVALYLLLTPARIEQLGHWGYVGVFVVAAIANATVIVPVPYFPLIARMGQVFNPVGIVLSAAAGSAAGESVAFFVGRAGRASVADTRLYRWMQRQFHHPWRATLVLFLLAAPPNPAFDVAGLLAGVLGLPLWMFLLAVFLGRILRMALFVLVGISFEQIISYILPVNE